MTRLSLITEATCDDATDCGYCHSKHSSVQYGAWAEVLTNEVYEQLIKHGWRRSGRYVYKPVANKTCCPTYSIRLDVEKFQPSKSQRKAQRRLDNELEKGSTYEELAARSRGTATDLASQPQPSAAQPPSAQGIQQQVAGAQNGSNTGTSGAPQGAPAGDQHTDAHASEVQELLQSALQDIISQGLIPAAKYPAVQLRPPPKKLLSKLGKTCRYTTPWACQLAATAIRGSDIRTDRQVQGTAPDATPNPETHAGAPQGPSQGPGAAAASSEPKDGETDGQDAKRTKGNKVKDNAIPQLAVKVAEALVQYVNSALGKKQGAVAALRAKAGPQGHIDFMAEENAVEECNMGSAEYQKAVQSTPPAAKASLKRAFECLAMKSGEIPELNMQDLDTHSLSLPQQTTPSSAVAALQQAAPRQYAVAVLEKQSSKEAGLAVGKQVNIEVDGSLQGSAGPLQRAPTGGAPGVYVAGPSGAVNGVQHAVGVAGGNSGAVQRTRWEIRTLPASHDLIPVEFPLYHKYQVRQHGDKPHEVTQIGFRRFLVDSPLIFVPPGGLGGSQGPVPSCGLGSFHQQYWLDGHLVAVGVVDVLPSFVSSVYCFWDPDLAHLSLGVICALQELAWGKALHATCLQLRYYTLGYYIPGCPKMVYKADYKPSDLLCPFTYCWAPHERVGAVLEPGHASTLPLITGATANLDAEEYNLTDAALQGKGLSPTSQQLLRTPLMLADMTGLVDKVTTFGHLHQGKVLQQNALKHLLGRLTRWHKEVGESAALSSAVLCQMSTLLGNSSDGDEQLDNDED